MALPYLFFKLLFGSMKEVYKNETTEIHPSATILATEKKR